MKAIRLMYTYLPSNREELQKISGLTWGVWFSFFDTTMHINAQMDTNVVCGGRNVPQPTIEKARIYFLP